MTHRPTSSWRQLAAAGLLVAVWTAHAVAQTVNLSGSENRPAPSELAPPPTSAPAREPAPLGMLPALIEVELRVDRTILPVGSPVMTEFVIRNRTPEVVVLQIPGTELAPREFEGAGLPLEHIFSGENYRAVRIVSDNDPNMGDRRAMKPEYPVPPLVLAPLSSVGLRFDLTVYYPFLHQAGRYELTWRPYGGAVSSPPVLLQVENYKLVILETNEGRLRLRLFYDKAPRTVANFLELVGQRFYDGLTFHRIEPGFAIAGGDPNGDGTGRRNDGITVPAEFNDTPFDLGTVGMSLAAGNPQSASSQFFITLGRAQSLDGNYTAFAQVEGPESVETLRKMGTIETDAQGRPKRPFFIKSAVIMDAPSLR